MKRLTERDAQGRWRIREFTESLPAYWQACNRLAAYEDTGLEPEEIVAAANRRHDCKIDCLLKKYNELSDAVADLGGIDHLRKLVQAEMEAQS